MASHKMSNHRLYDMYQRMKQRCYNQSHPQYNNHGGKGVYVCDEWKSDPALFFEWALKNGYTRTVVLDRIDENGPYSPDNCRWISYSENKLKSYRLRQDSDEDVQEGHKRNNKVHVRLEPTIYLQVKISAAEKELLISEFVRECIIQKLNSERKG